MQGGGHQQQRGMKCSELLHGERERLGIDHRCQEVNGVPDAAVRNNAVNAGEHRHGDASRQPAFDPCRDRVNLDGQPSPMHLGNDCDPHHFTPLRDDGCSVVTFAGTVSAVHEGNTSQNQPTQPATVNTAPKALT